MLFQRLFQLEKWQALRNVFIPVLFALLTVSCQLTENDVSDTNPHNIIYLIGDGMGVTHTSAYRYYKANQKTKARGDTQSIEETAFDRILVGMAATYPADDTLVTDSAASATALATGLKSFNGAIGVTPDHKAQLTLLEQASQLGMTTGVVVTAQVNHATPASFLSHSDSRHKYNEIADQYVTLSENPLNLAEQESPIVADIVLGGGTMYFDRDDRKLVKELQQKGYHYVTKMEQLTEVDAMPVLGLFAKKGLPFAIDSDQPNRLTHMTEHALRLASSNDKGFFLMIEGSQIDWCSHTNDIACSMAEMTDFEKTLELALAFAEKDGNTTVVVTADHSTGGLTLGRDKAYVWHAELVHKIRISAEEFGLQVADGQDPIALWKKKVDLPLSLTAQEALVAAAETKNVKKIKKAFAQITSNQTATGWTTTGHTGEDVQVFAFGPHKAEFAGYQDNTDIAKVLFSILERYY